MSQRSIILIGETGRAEFRSALRDLYARAEVIAAPDVESACAMLDPCQKDSNVDYSPLTAIVLVQSYHGRFAPADIDRLHRLAPLTPIVTLAGSLCEGEGRTGHPTPALVRIYWHRWTSVAARRLFPDEAERQGTLTRLPRIADEQDRLLVESTGPIARRRGLIGIVADRPETTDYLARICRLAGWSTTGLDPDDPGGCGPLDAAVLDVARFSAAERLRLMHFVERVAPAPVFAILGFPRRDEVEQVERCGAAAVLSKPFDVDDLLERLAEVAQSAVVTEFDKKAG